MRRVVSAILPRVLSAASLGGLLLIAGIIMMVNLIVDVLYGLINPRIRHN